MKTGPVGAASAAMTRHAGSAAGLEALPQRRGGGARTEAWIAAGRCVWPSTVVGIGDEPVEIGRLAGVALHVAIEEGGDEVCLDRQQSILAPDRILEPVQRPEV